MSAFTETPAGGNPAGVWVGDALPDPQTMQRIAAEDPATGAAAAALGGYLRDVRIIDVPAVFDIRQGEAMGRPSLLRVTVPGQGGITVTGTAVEL